MRSGSPLLVIIDVPGYLPGVRQEREGVVRRAAKPLHAFAESVADLAGQGQGLPEMTGGLLVTSCRPYI
jgi:acetyl-CoA carboxylase alpha subunit